MTNDLWKKHVHHRFPEESKTIKGPGKRETWFDLYERLSAETDRRLDQFINRSASKLRAEQESKYIVSFFHKICCNLELIITLRA